MNGAFMAAEIAEQPEVFRRILQDGRAEIEAVAGAIRRRAPRFVLLAARGTSDHAALYGKYLIETRLGLPAGLVSPSTHTVYGTDQVMNDVLYIGVSQSGSSPDLIEPITAARAAGAVTLAITNNAQSPLVEAAEYSIDVLAGPEQAVAATKTYTAELLTLYLLVAALAECGVDEVAGLPELAGGILSLGSTIDGLAVRYRFAEQIVVTSRGYNYPTALEAALKLMETSYLVAHGFSGADLLHGPMAMLRRGFPVIAVVPPGSGGAALAPVLDRLEEQRADVWIVGEREAAEHGTVGLALPALGPEIISPMLLILPLQHFAWRLALDRGSDPDQPEGLTKVTQTR